MKREWVGMAGAAVLSACVLAACGGSSDSSNVAQTTTTTVVARAVKVNITSPTSGAVIAANNVTIRGTVTPTDATVLVDGKRAPAGEGVFEATVRLDKGKTRIDVIASAKGAAPGSESLFVVRQTTAPAKKHDPVPQKHGPAKKVAVSATTTPASSATPNVADETSNQTSCGGGLYVGPDTTCEFAQNVENAYYENGFGTSSVYSPVTHDSYQMTCSPDGASEVECTGGNNAAVYFQG